MTVAISTAPKQILPRDPKNRVRTLQQKMRNLYSAQNDDLNKSEGPVAKAGDRADVWVEEWSSQAPATSQVYFTIPGPICCLTRGAIFQFILLLLHQIMPMQYASAGGMPIWKGEEQQHYNMERGTGWIPTGKEHLACYWIKRATAYRFRTCPGKFGISFLSPEFH